jgi:hypothetical protein
VPIVTDAALMDATKNVLERVFKPHSGPYAAVWTNEKSAAILVCNAAGQVCGCQDVTVAHSLLNKTLVRMKLSARTLLAIYASKAF